MASGGLGDVAGSLPKALRKRLVGCRVVMPLYSGIKQELRDQMQFITHITVPVSWRRQYCGIFEAKIDGVIFYFIDNEYYFKRDGIYGHYDDAERFAFFSRAVLEIIPHIGFKPDIIHTNDWQTALVPVYYSTMYANREGYEGIKNIFTIHNIQYQGVYGKEILGDVFGLGEQHEQLLDFGGTMLVVSHDRYFINKLSTRVLSIGMNGAESFEGGYDDYAATIAEQSAEKPKAAKTMGKGGEDYKRRKERESELRRTITAIKKCEERINELDGLIAKTNEEMSTPEAAADYARVMELTETLGKLNDEQTELMMQWEELENRKAQLEGEK